MSYKEIKAMQTAELATKHSALRAELIKLNGQAATGAAPKSPGLIRKTKKDIARILTEQTAREAKTK